MKAKAKPKPTRTPWGKGKPAAKAPAPEPDKPKAGTCAHGGDPALCQAIYCRAVRAARGRPPA